MKRERGKRSEVRDELYKFISDNPGIPFPAIQRAFKMNMGTLRYHLQYLEGEGRIRRLDGVNRRFCSSEMTREGILRMDGLTRDQKRIALIIKEKPGISLSEIRSVSRQNGDALKYSLKKLLDSKYIFKVENGKDPRFEFISKEKIVAQILAVILERFLRGEIDRATFFDQKNRIEVEFEIEKEV